MATIHFLNVLEGDCNIIQHDSGRLTVIDVSNAYNDKDTPAEAAVKASRAREEMRKRTQVPSNKTDYQQKKNPDNPIVYLKRLTNKDIWRFVITHPDMDHLDGIRDLYEEFSITHTWDTNNNKYCDPNSNFAGYNKEDWQFYTHLRSNLYNGTKRLALYAGEANTYWKEDNIKVLCPTKALVENANKTGDYNDASYVLLFTPPRKDGKTWKILFAGDSHDDSWNYILKNYKDEISGVDVLFAPHHGRDSSRSYEFLKTLKPRVTLFGNASSKHLAYSSYPKMRITNNQAGFVIINTTLDQLNFYVKNYDFMRDFRIKRKWELSKLNTKFNAYHVFSLKY